MREQRGIAIQPGPLPRGDGLTEVLGVPVDDDGGEQVETGHAVVLSLCGAIADFALPPDAQGVFQGVVCLALVQADLGPALHVGIEEPLDDEECALDAAYFAERDGQFVLARIPEPILRTPPGVDVFKVLIRQRVLIEDAGFVCRKVKQRRSLAGGQDRTMRHSSFAF